VLRGSGPSLQALVFAARRAAGCAVKHPFQFVSLHSVLVVPVPSVFHLRGRHTPPSPIVQGSFSILSYSAQVGVIFCGGKIQAQRQQELKAGKAEHVQDAWANMHKKTSCKTSCMRQCAP